MKVYKSKSSSKAAKIIKDAEGGFNVLYGQMYKQEFEIVNIQCKSYKSEKTALKQIEKYLQN